MLCKLARRRNGELPDSAILLINGVIMARHKHNLFSGMVACIDFLGFSDEVRKSSELKELECTSGKVEKLRDEFDREADIKTISKMEIIAFSD